MPVGATRFPPCSSARGTPPKSPMSTFLLEARALLPRLGERITRAAAAFGPTDQKATVDELRDVAQRRALGAFGDLRIGWHLCSGAQ